MEAVFFLLGCVRFAQILRDMNFNTRQIIWFFIDVIRLLGGTETTPRSLFPGW